VFCLNLHWRGVHNQGNCEFVRQLERLVNTRFDYRSLSSAGCAQRLLTLQLQQLLLGLDVMLEAWNSLDLQEKVDFPREKLFLKAIRGPMRLLPLVYDPKLKLFTQP